MSQGVIVILRVMDKSLTEEKQLFPMVTVFSASQPLSLSVSHRAKQSRSIVSVSSDLQSRSQ